VARSDLSALADRLYVLATALDDAEGDLEAGIPALDAYRHLAAAARGVLEGRVEPAAVGGP
jgi:hypothetical protein